MAADDLDREADRIRQARSLGRSGPLNRLFDHLIAAARDGVGRSEIDIATSVFGKPDTIDLTQDATARVYMHRLRAKLAAYYDRQGQDSAVRLTTPKGAYRIIMEQAAPAVGGTVATPVAPPRRSYLWGLAAVLVGLNLLVWLAVWPRQPAGEVFGLKAGHLSCPAGLQHPDAHSPGDCRRGRKVSDLTVPLKCIP